ncbi:hypothetical protein LIER_38652 [Lithospermum erythrorhizon]|uniref:Uncharacterized protein n=1 Tax=Lithospermum erythrorhizon TaxID=34254 RepID=A0AAV3Q409_LITER
MAHTKRTIRMMSPPPKRAKTTREVKFSSPPPSSSLTRPVVGLLSQRASPERAMHDSLSPLLDQGIMQRITNLGLGPQASHEASRMWLKATSASGSSRLSHRSVPIEPGPARRAGPRAPQAGSAGAGATGPPRSTRRERERLRRAYFKDNPLRCPRIGAAVLSDFVLNFLDQAPTLPVPAVEYKRHFPTGWLDNTAPLLPLDQILPTT